MRVRFKIASVQSHDEAPSSVSPPFDRKPPALYDCLGRPAKAPMSNVSNNSPDIDFRLPAELKHVVERAAALRGQSIGEFAISTVVENAHRIIEQHQMTELSDRDRDVFLALLDDDHSRPSEALFASVERYKEWLRGIENGNVHAVAD